MTETEHDWDGPTYERAADNSSVTATRVCKNDASHVETETVNTIGEVSKLASCTENGETSYTAIFTNHLFYKLLFDDDYWSYFDRDRVQQIARGETPLPLNECFMKEDLWRN